MSVAFGSWLSYGFGTELQAYSKAGPDLLRTDTRTEVSTPRKLTMQTTFTPVLRDYAQSTSGCEGSRGRLWAISHQTAMDEALL